MLQLQLQTPKKTKEAFGNDATTPGVNGWRQVAPAPPVVDLAGVVPVAASRPDSLAPSGAAGLQAVIEALRYIQSPGYPAARQALLHVSDGAAARLAAGVWNPEGGKELVESARLELRRLRRGGTSVWMVVEAVPGHVWLERSSALALTAAGRYNDGNDADDECPICLTDYDDRLPGVVGKTRALAGVFACGHWKHSMCRDCLAGVLASNQRRCPVCRAAPVP